MKFRTTNLDFFRGYIGIQFLVLLFFKASASGFEWQQGDIIAQAADSPTGQVQMIKNATNSIWTHVGVVVEDEGKMVVFEAVQPVGSKPLNQFLSKTQKYRVLRLKKMPKNKVDVSKRIRLFTSRHMGKPYDFKFLWSDEKMYCSELVWKFYNEVYGVKLCQPKPFESYELDDPLVAKAVVNRFGGRANIPKNHKVVAPSDVMSSPLLEDVTAAYRGK